MPPNIVCTGQVRALPTLEGIQPRKPGSPFGFSPPHPALAGKTCRWLAHLKLGKKESKIRGLTAGLVLYTILI